MPIVTSRRSFLAGLFVSAPAVIAYDKLMPVKLFMPDTSLKVPTVEVEEAVSSLTLQSAGSGYNEPVVSVFAEANEWGYSQNPILHTKVLIEAIKKEVNEASQQTIFEPNDALTRDAYKTRLSSYLAGLQTERKISGFTVVCDETNNTLSTINERAFFSSIYVKPARTINYIKIDSIVTLQGMQYFPIRA